MGLDKFVNTFGAVCRDKYGERLRKLTIDAKFTCPIGMGRLVVVAAPFVMLPHLVLNIVLNSRLLSN